MHAEVKALQRARGPNAQAACDKQAYALQTDVARAIANVETGGDDCYLR
jgi:hypothetical protein